MMCKTCGSEEITTEDYGDDTYSWVCRTCGSEGSDVSDENVIEFLHIGE